MSPIDISKFEQLKASGALPSPRGVALAILRLTQQENASMVELARIVKSDPAFAGRVIKAANSVNASPGRPVVAVPDALIVLGMPTVRNLALGFSLLSQYKQGACKTFDYQRFWSGSLACALALQALTLHTHAAQPEETFSVGLLARVGELALATMFPDQYSRVLQQTSEDRDGRLLDLEQRSFAMDHCELSAAMLSDWGLPRIFSDPVCRHENPDQSSFPEGSREYMVVQSLALSREIAATCLATEAQRPARMPRLLALAERLSIGAEELKQLCDGVAREWMEWAAILNVATQPLPSFEELEQTRQAPSAPAEQGGVRGESTSLRALVVADESAMRRMLKHVLEQAGYQVFESADAEQGLRAALDCQPQIMVVDWMLPQMDGLALTRALRETRIGRGLYILILTAVADEAKLIEAFEAGVDDYMSKPVNAPLLAARLHAGQRIVRMQQEIERDHEEIRRFAAELAITNRRLQEVALTDALTGFPNRRYAMERIQQEWSATTRSKRPLACMVIDLDQFKQINDTYGHDVGDAYLRQTAEVVRGSLRVQDVVCRTGGDEFLVICPDTDQPAAMACAERVRCCVESTLVNVGMLRLKATLSAGVAVREPVMADAEALIKCADQGLYMAKQRGRNRVATPQATPCPE